MGYWKREYTERRTVRPLFRDEAAPDPPAVRTRPAPDPSGEPAPAD